MANVEAARAELGHIERILRTRYHYPHPIFEHIAAAQAALDADAPVPAVAVEDVPEAPPEGAEAEVVPAGSPGPTTTDAEPPTTPTPIEAPSEPRARGKRGNR